MNNKDLARLIVDRRKDKKLSQEGVAKTAGLSRSYYSDIERGLRNISVESLVRICMALDTRASIMLKHLEETMVAEIGGASAIDGAGDAGDHNNTGNGNGNSHIGDGGTVESRDEQPSTKMQG